MTTSLPYSVRLQQAVNCSVTPTSALVSREIYLKGPNWKWKENKSLFLFSLNVKDPSVSEARLHEQASLTTAANHPARPLAN